MIPTEKVFIIESLRDTLRHKVDSIYYRLVDLALTDHLLLPHYLSKVQNTLDPVFSSLQQEIFNAIKTNNKKE